MAAGVPVAVPSTEVPVRDEVAVRPLLALLEVALNVAMEQSDPIDTQTAVDAVLSPIGGADAVGLRRLRRALRRDASSTAAADAPATSCSPTVSSRQTRWGCWVLRVRRLAGLPRRSPRE